MRKVFIGGNWKCNNTLKETQTLVTDVVDKLEFNHEKVCKKLILFRGCSCPNLSSSDDSLFH